jgi:hypothetical protein
MSFPDFNPPPAMRKAWNAVRIERAMPYTLFTFGSTDLPYYLVVEGRDDERPAVSRGQITITRPTIITPHDGNPEFDGFFESDEEGQMIELLMARGVSFPNVKFSNTGGRQEISGDNVEHIVSLLKERLDSEDEDRVAILSAPHGLGGMALMRYAVEKAVESTPDNLTELRDRGFLDI